MPALTIKNIPDTLYEQLKEAARLHRRSLNSEILYCIERAIGAYKTDISEAIEIARKLRTKTALHLISDDELSAVKNEGRP